MKGRLRIPIFLVLGATALGAVTSAVSARTAADFFTTAPDSIYTLLPQATRLDMLDYYRFGSEKASQNAFGGEARVTYDSPASITYTLTENASGQLAVMTAADADTVLAVVTTLATPHPDSEIRWFFADWKPLAPPDMPLFDDWLSLAGRRNRDRARLIVPFMLTKAEIDSTATTLTLTGAARDFVAPGLRAEADSLFIPRMTFSLRGTKLSRR